MVVRKTLLAALGLLASLIGGEAKPLVLVESGEARFEIIIPKEATVIERYAAKELQQAVRRATGAEARIVSDDERKEGAIPVYLGTPGRNNAAASLGLKEAGKLALDQVLVQTGDQALILSGNNPRSVLYSVYRFLEEALSYRWFWPGEEGEFYQKTDRLAVENLRIQENAAIRYRSLGINHPGYNDDLIVWMARNRLNVVNTHKGTKPELSQDLHEKGFLNRFGGHNLLLPRKILEEHPEYLALYGGRRVHHPGHTSQLCWSNKGVQQALVEEMKTWPKRYPMVDVWGVHPADRVGYCECEECVAMAPDVSTRYQKLWTILIESIKETDPQANFACLAYQDYRDVPTFVAPFDVGVQYAAYNVSYRHSLLSNHPANQVPIREMLEWQKLGARTGYRGYEMIPFVEPMYTPLVHYVVDGARFAARHDFTYYATEVSPNGYPQDRPPEERNWETNRMNLYAFAQALWDRSADAKALVRDWTRHVYGPGGEAMERYNQAMENAWRNAPGDISYFLHPAALYAKGFISKELIENAEALFTEARQKIETASDAAFRERALAQVTFEEKMFGRWQEQYSRLAENSNRLMAYASHTEASNEEILQPNYKGWEKAWKLPEFLPRKGTLNDQTDVYALWSGDTLYLKFLCHDSRKGERKALFKNHDEDIYSDESIEIFLNTNDGYSYYHLAFNSLGAKFDARSLGGMNFDRSADPNWTVKVQTGRTSWGAVIALPLKEFGLTVAEGKEVALSLKRTRPGGDMTFPNSGWPDASYHSPISAGSIRLVKKAPAHLLLIGGQPDSTGGVEAAATGAGWRVSRLTDKTNFSLETYDAILLYFRYEHGFGTTDGFIQESILPWLEKGGLLIVSAGRGQLPFERWFSKPELDLKWSRWTVEKIRRTTFVADGEWSQTPFSLDKAFGKDTTPASGYLLERGEPWESLAAQKTTDGADAHFLLRTRIGEGTLILTSSGMGLRGGFEIFGNQRPYNVIGLIGNLYHEHQKAR